MKNIAAIMIVGAGVVGQANGKGLAKNGHEVIFIDKNPAVIRTLKQQGFKAILPNDIDSVNADISIFCVPTPSKEKDGDADLSHITEAITHHSHWLRNSREKNNNNGRDSYYHLFVIRSTVPPGTTEDILLGLIEKYSGMRVGKDIGLCMQPEFLRNISSENDFLHPRLTVIGEYDKRSGDILEKIFTDFDGRTVRVNLKTAEFIKYVHNCFNATKISFSNEMWLLGKKLGIDANLALELAAISAEGFWNPGYGIVGGQPFGGPCIPKDVEALLSVSRKDGFGMPLLSAVVSLNKLMQEMAKEGKVPPATVAPPKKRLCRESSKSALNIENIEQLLETLFLTNQNQR